MIPSDRLKVIAYDAIHEHGALQDEWEMAMMLQISEYADPAVIVEIGSHTGGSLYAWRQVQGHFPAVFGVTMDTEYLRNTHGAEIVIGDSTSVETQSKLTRLLDGMKPDIVFVDGGHDEFTCRADVNWALTMVRKGLVIVHDINLHIRYPECGVRTVWDQMRHRFPSMEIVNEPNNDPGVGILWVR